LAEPAPVTVTPEPGVTVTTLANELRVVSERIPGSRSLTLGVVAGVGARDEPAEVAGASHFLEHLVFKGTADRSARAIAEAIDAVGGEMNAYTAKEHTSYYARLPASAADMGVALLGDVVTSPAFRPAEVEAERQVILEELLLSEDEPSERVHTLVLEAMFPGHPLGREVLGDHASISAMSRADIAAFFDHWYRPRNLVVAAAGDLPHEQLVEAVVGWFDQNAGERPRRQRPQAPAEPFALLSRPTEQAHLAMAWPAVDAHHDDRYALGLFNQILGGGLSSRLFQEIRESRGLAYSVFSYTSLFDDAGCLVAYAGTAPARFAEVRELIDVEVDRLVADGVSEAEVELAKGYVEGATVLGLEDTASRMGRLANGLAVHGEIVSVADGLARVRAVTVDEVNRVARAVLGAARTVAAVGPVRDEALSR
jgi:predicted Zn-dependent peptidase